jgi:hypothetical protein
MKSKEEIEQLAKEHSIKLDNDDDAIEFGFIEGYTQCQEDVADKKYTEEDMLKAIEKARDIFDGKDCFTAEDVSGCTEVCTYNWKFQFSEDDIINSLNK